jgi:hypothetical protein
MDADAHSAPGTATRLEVAKPRLFPQGEIVGGQRLDPSTVMPLRRRYSLMSSTSATILKLPPPASVPPQPAVIIGCVFAAGVAATRRHLASYE